MNDNDKEEKFQTHIKEPRWQQVLSIIIVLVVAGIWAWLILRAIR